LFNSLQIKFLIFIAIVFIITAGFAILISRQMKVVGQKALAAKERQNAYQKQLDTEQKEIQSKLDAEQKEEPGE
jgi:Tfp pilus assembly protein PilO